MTGKTHLAAGISLGCGLCLVAQPAPLAAVAVLGGATLSSLLPDIDTASSKLGHRIAPLAWILRILFGHRSVFHSLAFWAVTSGTIFLIFGNALFAISVFLGAGSHLLLDMLNPSGIELLWPYKKRISLARLQCGGIVDHLLTLIFSGTAIWLGYLYFSVIH